MSTSGGFLTFLREYVAQGLLLILLLIPVFPGVFLRGEMAISGNAIYKNAPWRAQMPGDLRPQQVNLETPRQTVAWYYLTRQAMREGQWPLWNPYQFAGVPLIGAYQTAVFYPPRLLFLLVDDLYVAMTIFVLLKLWLAGIVAYLCARGLSMPRRYARFFSIAYMLGGYMISWCSYTVVDSLAWAPLLFLGIEYILDRRWLRGYATALVAATMMALAAGAQHTLTFSLMLGVYFCARVLASRSPALGARAVATAGAAAATALFVTAIQVLPFLEMASQSLSLLKSLFHSDATDYHYLITDAPIFWSPWYFGTYLHGNFWGRMNPFYLNMAYVGVPCWVGAALAIRTRHMAPMMKVRVRCLLLATAVTLWLSFDAPGAALVPRIPGLQNVRLVYFMSFFAFSMPLITAFALQHAFSGPRRARGFVPLVIVACVIFAIMSAHLVQMQPTLRSLSATLERSGTLVESLLVNGIPAFPFQPQGGTLNQFVLRQYLWTVAILVLSTGCLLTIYIKRLPRTFGMTALTAVLVLDLWSAWCGLQPTSKRAEVFPANPVMTELQKRGHPYRINFDAIGINGLSIPYGLEELQGYDAMVPERFWTTLRGALNFRGNIVIDRTIAAPCYLYLTPRDGAPQVPEGFEIVDVRDGVVVAVNPRALPRARLAGTVEWCASQEALMQRVNGPGFDPADLALVEGPDAPRHLETSTGPPGTARITQWSWNAVTVECDATRPAVLVLAESYYPGWEALIDEKERAAIFPVYHVFRGVVVPKGTHTVAFTYRPLSFRIGAIASTMTLAALLICGTLILYRNHKIGPST